MLALLLAAAVGSGSGEPGALSDFRAVCIETKAALPAVAQVASRRGWVAGGRSGSLQTWAKTTDGGRMMLLAGVAEGGRPVCNVQVRPAAAGLARSLPAGLGPKAATVDVNKGLYLIADSAGAARRGGAAFVTVTTTDESTMLVYLRPKR